MKGTRKGHFFPLRLYLLPVTPPQILIPALMITAEKDQVLVPEMSKHMEDWVRGCCRTGAVGASGRGHRCPKGEAAAEDRVLDKGLHQELHCHL